MSSETQADCPMTCEPQEEHKWLEQLVGEWQYEAQCTMGPDEPSAKVTGAESVRCVGGLWVVAEGEGEMPGGGSATSIMTLGYDPAKGTYLGTFIASMMAHLWVYDESEMDAAKRVLSLYAKGPNMDPSATSKMAQYKDVIEIISDNERKLSGHVQSEDGQWMQIMTATYRRER